MSSGVEVHTQIHGKEFFYVFLFNVFIKCFVNLEISSIYILNKSKQQYRNYHDDKSISKNPRRMGLLSNNKKNEGPNSALSLEVIIIN